MVQSIFRIKGNGAKLTAYMLILLALVFGFFSRVVSVFRYVTFDIGPSPDQVRDAYIYMNMWQGSWPTLGPSASVGGYHLPPLYYYLVFPFTAFGADPVYQALPNAIFSFLSIPLLIYLVYQLLEENIKLSKRLIVAGLAGCWYSLLFGEIFISTFHWNPSPIPFFLICFILLYKYQLEADFNVIAQSLCWLLYGITLAILMSLHSTTLFVMPLVFMASSTFFIYRNRRTPKKWLLPGLSISSTLIALLPYWRGELSRGFLNTKQIIITVISSSQDTHRSTILQRLSRAVINYFELGQQAYFLGSSWVHVGISTIFLSLILFLGIGKFKGNRTIMMVLVFTWLVYLYAASNYKGIFFLHYKMLIIFAPIIFSSLSIAYLDFSQKNDRFIIIILILGISFSAWTNLTFNYKYLYSKYGRDRLVATADIIYILNQLPAKSTFCDPHYEGARKLYNQYKYIDTYITKKGLKWVKICQSGDYILQPKSKMVQPINNLWPVFSISKNQVAQENSSLFLETPVAYVYVSK